MSAIKNISVVLPVYNEEGNIAEVVKKIFDTLPSVTSDFEIIAVDDGSVDGTPKILENLKFSDSRLQVVRHATNKGYGAALVSGFASARKEFILMMDADRQFDIGEIGKFIPYAQDYDIVAGFRVERNDPFYRRVVGRVFNLLMKIIFGINMKDVKCGFKLFRTDLLHKMHFRLTGGSVNIEIFIQAIENKARIKEVGVRHYPRIYGKQTGGSPKVILRAIWEILRLKMGSRIC